ncbi:histidinol dehydrogenase [Listeria cossartiae subsp. cayugensis]|uniref:Histidinol dehydrogenase n=1 Tax=Listeria cossartiae subsp. cayugensis TaxID=2713505 RepID=A0ABU2ILX2_9LIST|nr:histidinol dehydrogenase [Listeria cossartiae]MDT0049179.1 histidinol dehydrogenase [Listeria cossartiae subsp. cayugensis]MDT0065682.1 histidinol dehydrogenase [Listeria cossartiae subsp. cayugensis]MDT0078714.1 histidinol dehydrogenase [Listeria cossartiae subsp. cayugensis]MDT0081550.1 histidinol dehydrogenase [Listeria cossartiae subsp. cayugensis]MDT0087915.1 histidinol dehydrogenase [Listeria cossartiae subsp. cayugensis]
MKIVTGTTAAILNELKTETTTSTSHQVETTVKAIIEKVKIAGDQALLNYTIQFDGVNLTELRVSNTDIQAATAKVEPAFLDALRQAKANIESFHSKQKQHAFLDSEKDGVIRGQLIRPLETVGVYVPGGTAAYPSSVLMNVLPAKIAGVKRIVMITPPGENGINPHVLAAAQLAGVDEIYQVGGAHGIAALAYGTESIPKVDKIVGPGNVYVATAKREVFGLVDIDMIAGPSEIVVLADETANPAFIAADLLSQAEHDTLARAILITTSENIAQQTKTEITKQLETLPRKAIAQESIETQGKIIIATNTKEMFDIMNEIAPEHLEVQLENPMNYLHQIKNAGSIFLGSYASEPLGDYFAGPNHVLPTSGTAKFFSPLGVEDFTKRSAYISYTKEALAKEKDAIILLANKEGLDAHAKAIQIRFEEEN